MTFMNRSWPEGSAAVALPAWGRGWVCAASTLLLLLLLLPAAGAVQAGPGVPPTVQQVCVACHGLDGDSADPERPRLAGLDSEYLLRQLRAYASGKRRDETMSSIVSALDPGEFALLAAYYGAQPPLSGRAEAGDPELVRRGQAIYDDGNTDSGVPACAGCHQADGRGNARFPRLAGQHAAYVQRQLLAYKSGRRATDPLMTTVGRRLRNDEIEAVAAYVAAMPGK